MILNMRNFTSILTLFGLLTIAPVSAYAQTNSAQTKPAGNDLYDPVSRVVTANLMSNFSDGKFHPQKMISRSELATIMVKTFRLDKQKAALQENAIVVADVSTNHQAFDDIQTVLKTGVMRGYRGNLFFPNQKVTRAEALAIFAQAYGIFQFSEETVNQILLDYQDQKSIPVWSRKAIATVATEGFIEPDPDGNLSPLLPMSRGDMAMVLSKYLQRRQEQPNTPLVPAPAGSPVTPR
ncbi:MAG: S-layer homology domain-containing protein [Cyanobacteria bacterium P01_A01_bin.45]